MMKHILLLAALAAGCANATRVADTLNDGQARPLNGSCLISWPSFVTAAGRAVTGGSRTIEVRAGVLDVTLNANAGATPNNSLYRVQCAARDLGAAPVEWWVVPESQAVQRLADVRVGAGGSMPAAVYTPNRALRTDAQGRAVPVTGTLTDCVRVDGSSGACGSGGGGGGGGGGTVVANEVPAGTINGTNATFTLAQVLTPGSETLFRNGLALARGVDYTIAGQTITFLGAAAIPLPGDIILASYVTGEVAGSYVGAENPLTFASPLTRVANTIDINETLLSISWLQVTGIPPSFPPSAHTHSAADVTSGTLADARISQSSVKQHEAALSVGWGQIPDKPSTFSPSAHNHAASDVTSGTFADARISQSSVKQHEAALSVGWAQIPDKPSTFAPSAHTHPASDIASGQVALARGGTGADLSATGGAGQFLRQATPGGAVSVGAIAASDVPTLNQNTTGNAGTATALAADGTDCSSGQAARGVDAQGNATGCFTPSGGGVDVVLANYFGTGEDGDVTCSGASTLSKDMYYNNLTVQSGCAITAHGYRIFVRQTLDITAAPAGWLVVNGANGGNASGATAGTLGTGGTNNVTAGVTVGSRLNGTAGAAGGTGVGVQAGTSTILTGTNGGSSGAGGAGGSGGSGAGGAARTLPAVVPRPVASFQPQPMTMHGTGLGYMQGGGGGAGGSSGAGDGTNTGGGGGGGPSGGGVIWLSAQAISRGPGTAANGIQAMGGNGGVGGSRVTGNCGGGGGGGGAGGGWVLVYYWQLSGTTAVNHIEVDGGSGGNGGNAAGTGVPGSGGTGGACGRVTLINLQTATSSTTGGGVGSAASGQTGGAGCLLSVSL